MKTRFTRTKTVALGLAATFVLVACSLPQGGGRPGDYASNYANAPMSSLYPGNYPQTPTSMISSH